MRNNRNHTSVVPGKNRASTEQSESRHSKRPEGAVTEHRKRISKNTSTTPSNVENDEKLLKKNVD